MDGLVDGWMYEWTEGRINGSTVGGRDEWMEG
jgi:hypothetical protein